MRAASPRSLGRDPLLLLGFGNLALDDPMRLLGDLRLLGGLGCQLLLELRGADRFCGRSCDELPVDMSYSVLLA